jgi:hypothetical protein
MTADVQQQSDKYVLEVTSELAVEFSGLLSRPTVTNTVLDARRDLEGQIVPEALGEMLHRLAHHRLNCMCAAK